MAALLLSFLKDFRESFLTAPVPLALVQKVRKTYLYLKCHQTKKFSSGDIDILFIAAL